MLTREDDINAHALHRQGWTISAIARHLDCDRKTVRAYLTGQRQAGIRAPAGTDPFEDYVTYVRERLTEDPHLWAITLFDEITNLGYPRSYPTFTRQLRDRTLRPHCEPCAGTRGRAAAVFNHPPGEEIQWDWVELPDPPAAWGWGKTAHLLVGALPHSGKWRAVLAASEDQPHLIAALDTVTRKLGGVPRAWRFDRMRTVCDPGTGKVTASFAAVAKYYGVSVAICPPRSGNRKGVVEKSNHAAAQRWWRTVPDDATLAQAGAGLDAWCARRGDARARPAGPDGKQTVADLAGREGLAPTPRSPYPATLTEQRTVSAQALVAWKGNTYSVPPGLARASVNVAQRLGASELDITAPGGELIARHRAAPDGAGAMIRDDVHVTALEHLVLAGHDTRVPHRAKERIPPGAAALAAAAELSAHHTNHTANAGAVAGTVPGAGTGVDVVINLEKYAAAANGRNTLT